LYTPTQHTSFLWRLATEPMAQYLTLPAKRPAYRGARSHSDFLCDMTTFLSKTALDARADAPQSAAALAAAAAGVVTRAAAPAECVFERAVLARAAELFDLA